MRRAGAPANKPNPRRRSKAPACGRCHRCRRRGQAHHAGWGRDTPAHRSANAIHIAPCSGRKAQWRRCAAAAHANSRAARPAHAIQMPLRRRKPAHAKAATKHFQTAFADNRLHCKATASAHAHYPACSGANRPRRRQTLPAAAPHQSARPKAGADSSTPPQAQSPPAKKPPHKPDSPDN